MVIKEKREAATLLLYLYFFGVNKFLKENFLSR
jgi:hypothetical protein